MGKHRRLAIVAVLAAAFLSGCSTMLPRSRAEDVSHFKTYEDARVALERVTPYRDTLVEARALGFDVADNSNVREVPYPQWVGTLVNPNVPLDHADVGIRDCLAAELACRAYLFRFSRIEEDRTGNFVVDFLNFRRVTHRHGWRFEGLMLVRDGVVLFRNHGGEPRVEFVEDRRNPLGPLQGIGESSGRLVN
jgi:hypothetical protein